MKLVKKGNQQPTPVSEPKELPVDSKELKEPKKSLLPFRKKQSEPAETVEKQTPPPRVISTAPVIPAHNPSNPDYGGFDDLDREPASFWDRLLGRNKGETRLVKVHLTREVAEGLRPEEIVGYNPDSYSEQAMSKFSYGIQAQSFMDVDQVMTMDLSAIPSQPPEEDHLALPDLNIDDFDDPEFDGLPSLSLSADSDLPPLTESDLTPNELRILSTSISDQLGRPENEFIVSGDLRPTFAPADGVEPESAPHDSPEDSALGFLRTLETPDSELDSPEEDAEPKIVDEFEGAEIEPFENEPEGAPIGLDDIEGLPELTPDAEETEVLVSEFDALDEFDSAQELAELNDQAFSDEEEQIIEPEISSEIELPTLAVIEEPELPSLEIVDFPEVNEIPIINLAVESNHTDEVLTEEEAPVLTLHEIISDEELKALSDVVDAPEEDEEPLLNLLEVADDETGSLPELDANSEVAEIESATLNLTLTETEVDHLPLELGLAEVATSAEEPEPSVEDVGMDTLTFGTAPVSDSYLQGLNFGHTYNMDDLVPDQSSSTKLDTQMLKLGLEIENRTDVPVDVFLGKTDTEKIENASSALEAIKNLR